jgi:hypothetical protein
VAVAGRLTHLLHIHAKLAARDRASAVAAGHKRGLLVPTSPTRIFHQLSPISQHCWGTVGV